LKTRGRELEEDVKLYIFHSFIIIVLLQSWNVRSLN